MRKILFVLFMSYITLFSNATISLPIYSYNDLGSWSIVAINDRGAVVGSDGNSIILYQDGHVSNLGSFGGNPTGVSDINNHNQIVGGYRSGSGSHAYQYENGNFTDLHEVVSPIYHPLSAGNPHPIVMSNSRAIGINDNGQIVINANSGGGPTVNSYIFENGELTDLGQWDTPYPDTYLGSPERIVAQSINNAGQIVGSGETGNGAFPVYLWDEDAGLEWIITDTPRMVTDINDAGQVVGHGRTSSTGRDHYSGAWLWEDGAYTELFPGTDYSSIDAINNSGMMVGRDPEGHLVLIQDDEMQDLTSLISPDPSAPHYDIVDINNFGDIIGTHYLDTDNDGVTERHGFLLTPDWDRVTSEQHYFSDTLTLGDRFQFDIWWDLGLDAADLNLDIFAYIGAGTEVLDFEINAPGSSLDWETLVIDIPEWARGRDAKIMYSMADVDLTTDPTVYLRNIGSVSVPEPTTLLLMMTGLTVLFPPNRSRNSHRNT